MITQYGTRIEWVASFNERIQHAHVSPTVNTIHCRQVCKPNIFLASPEYWKKIKKQPKRKCKNCQSILKILGSRAIAMIDVKYPGEYHKGIPAKVEEIIHKNDSHKMKKILTTSRNGVS